MLALPRLGCINLHGSLLPKYRGPAPVQSAILNGDTQTGVSIIKLDKYLDHGPVIAQIEKAYRLARALTQPWLTKAEQTVVAERHWSKALETVST